MPKELKEKFEYVGEAIEDVAEDGVEIAKEVSEAIREGAEEAIEIAKKLAPYLKIGLDCIIILVRTWP